MPTEDIRVLKRKNPHRLSRIRGKRKKEKERERKPRWDLHLMEEAVKEKKFPHPGKPSH